MKKLAAAVLMVLLAATAYADDKLTDTLGEVLKTVVSPVETILGQCTELQKIVVTPSRSAEKIVSSSCSVSVVDRVDFDRSKIDTAKEALKDEVGIDIRQAGAFQGEASILMRGGNANQTLVLIDGIKAYDPIAPGGAYNIAHLTLDNVDSIEILRGPQSALYGSDAMAGVVSVSTRKAEDTYVQASFEAGSFYTYKEGFEIGSVAHGLHYSFAGSRVDTRGISQAEAKADCQERDPYDRTSLAGRVDYDISDKAAVGATLRWTKAHFAIDQGANADDDNAFSIFRESFITLFADQELFSRWSHHIKLGWMETMRQYFDDDSPLLFGMLIDFDRSKYSGKNFTMDYQNDIDILDIDKVIIGYEYTEEAAKFFSQNDFSGFMANDIMPEATSREGDLYLESRLNVADRLTSTQGARVSHHSRAGTHMTYRIDGSYLFFTGTKVRGLAATGFKAPSLYQLFAPANLFFGGGNPNLQPEKSASYEYGVDQYLFGEKIIAGVTYFHTIYTDLIDALTDPNTFMTNQYINIGKSQVHGIEASFTVRPTDSIKLIGGLTYQKTKDFQNDQELIRRPERKFFIGGFWQATKKLSLDLRMRYNGPMSDNLSNPLWGLDAYKVKEFVVVNGVANYDISRNLSVYVKMENMFNKYYEEVRGFGTVPFSLYGGIKAKF